MRARSIWRRRRPGGDAARAAFLALAQQYGPRAPPGSRARRRSPARRPRSGRAPRSPTCCRSGGSSSAIRATQPGRCWRVGPPIADSLPVGPAPDGPGLGHRRGHALGHGLRPRHPGGHGVPHHVDAERRRAASTASSCSGCAATSTPPESVKRLSALLQAHHYTDGLELLPHGAPTNNTDDVKSALTTRDPNYAGPLRAGAGAAALSRPGRPPTAIGWRARSASRPTCWRTCAAPTAIRTSRRAP